MPSNYMETNRTASPVRFLNDGSPKPSRYSPYKQTMNHYKSMGKMPCNRSKSNLSPHRASVLQDTSYLQSKHFKQEVKPSIKDLEFNAIKSTVFLMKKSKID